MGHKNILLIGYYVSHVVGSKVELLKALGYNVHALDVGNYDLTAHIYRPTSLHTYNASTFLGMHNSRLLRYKNEMEDISRSYELIKENEEVARVATRVMKEIEPDIIWGVWGDGVLKWLRAFRRNGFKGKMCWTANVFPNNITHRKLSSEHMLYARWLHRLDGIMLTGHRMLEFMHHEYPETQHVKYVLLPDYLPRNWFARTVDNSGTKNNEAHVVYLGSPERYGKTIDRVDSYLLEMANAGIHIHCAKPKETSINHPLIHFYSHYDDASFINGEFGQFVNQFDAAIVLYNHERYNPRFASTLPTRFLVALCGCIPIFTRKGSLLACEEFVEENGIGKAYEDTLDLKGMLMDRSLMHRLGKASEKNAAKFASDNDSNISLLKRLFDHSLEC